MRWFCFVRHISTSMQLMQVIHMINKSRRYSSYTSRHKNNWHEIIRHKIIHIAATSLLTEHLHKSILRSPAITHGNAWHDSFARTASILAVKFWTFCLGCLYIPPITYFLPFLAISYQIFSTRFASLFGIFYSLRSYPIWQPSLALHKEINNPSIYT